MVCFTVDLIDTFYCMFEVHCLRELYSALTCLSDNIFVHISLRFCIYTNVTLRLKVMYILSAGTCLYHKKYPVDKEFSLRNYGPMTNCWWILEGSVGHKLQLTVSLISNN